MKPKLQFVSGRYGRRAVLAAGACALALAASACSSQNEVASFRRENNFMGGDPMAAIGIRPRKRERIDYDPRSPLVMPAQPELQQPKEEVALGEQWPDDPDERRQAEQDARDEYLREKADKEDRSRALKPQELNDWAREAGMRSSGGTPTTGAGSETRTVRILSPTELFRGRRAEADPTAEPERRRLTDPPDGYRKAVPDENGEVHTASEDEKPRRGIRSWFGF